MPYAYDWLSEENKKKISEIHIGAFDDRLTLVLKWNSWVESTTWFTHYHRKGSNTLLALGNSEKIVPQYFVDIFLADLRILLKNQQIPLALFYVTVRGSGEITAKIYECLERTLKEKSPALIVRKFAFRGTTATKGISLTRYLNYDALDAVCCRVPDESTNFEDFLTGLGNLEKGYRFYSEINMNEIDEKRSILTKFSGKFSKEDLEILNQKWYSTLSDKLGVNRWWDDWKQKFGINAQCLFQTGSSISVKFQSFKMSGSDLFKMSTENESWIMAKKKKYPGLSMSPTETPNTDVGEATRTVMENPLWMQPILRRLECFDIQRLRKVNRGVRECIDTVKPNPCIENCSVLVSDHQLITNITLASGELEKISYWTQGNLSFVNGQHFRSSNYKTLFFNDLETTLNHQKSCIEELSIIYELSEKFMSTMRESLEELSTKMRVILSRREHPLRTRKFAMGIISEMEVMEILSAIDEEFLETIEFLHPLNQLGLKFERFEEFCFDVGQLSQTSQWNNAQQLISKYATITTPIQDLNILHFAKLEILVDTLSSQDVFYLKTKLLKSSKFQKFKISFWESAIDELLHTLIGAPYRNFSDVKKVWYFQMDNTDYYIHIVLNTRDVKNEEGNLKPKMVIFTRVAKEDTPFFELPINQLVIN